MRINIMVTVDIDEASFIEEMSGAPQDAIPGFVETRVRWGVNNQFTACDVYMECVHVEVAP
jgi:hypothetical protein